MGTRIFTLACVLSFIAVSMPVNAQTFQGTVTISGEEIQLPLCRVHTCTDVWGAGTVGITVNGVTASASYGQGATVGSVAAMLCSKMNSTFPVQCTGSTPSGNNVVLNLVADVNDTLSSTCRITVPATVTGCLFQANISAAYNPQYYILSVLYSPPGNASSNGYTNTASTGASTSVGSNFAAGTSTSITASAGILGQSTFGVTFGVSASNGQTNSFSVTYQQGSGTQLRSTEQTVDHTQDQIFLWLNPQVTFNSVSNSTTAATAVVGTVSGQPMDVVNVSVAGLQNPTLIPLAVLLPQTPLPGVTVPGLANVCAHALPPAQCTQANACGCVATDFAAILKADPLIGVGETVPPSSIDSQRFVLVNFQTLEGPQQVGGGTVTNSFTESDSTLQSVVDSESQTISTSYTTGGGFDIPDLFSLKITDTNSFSWTTMQTQGVQNGAAHTASVTFGSNKVGCFTDVDIYEDTVYHTFAFAYPVTPPAACQ